LSWFIKAIQDNAFAEILVIYPQDCPQFINCCLKGAVVVVALSPAMNHGETAETVTAGTVFE
jgi:hypothetical protein